MKKLIFIVAIIMTYLYSNVYDNTTKKYMEYTNKIIGYNFDLKHFKDIHPPFESFEFMLKTVNGKKIKSNKTLIKTIKIKLLSIFNKKARFLIKVYLGGQLIKIYTKWVTIGSKISNCIVKKMTLDSVFLQCKNKILIKTLNKKIPGIKEQQ